MDITFQSNQQKFNYRVCGMMIHDGKILAMQDERSPYFYLPGGRVKLGETAEEAVIRELREELGITPKILRPLWLCQSFFREEVDRLHYHELCIFFLWTWGIQTSWKKESALPRRKETTPMYLPGWLLRNWRRPIFIPCS